MRYRDIMRTAFGNLGRHKARTALTTVGVIVGILTIVTMVSLGIGVQQEMLGAFDSVGLETLRLYPETEEVGAFDLFGQPPRTVLITPALIEELQARDDVLSVIPFLSLPNGLQMTLRMNDQEIRADATGRRPASIPDPFEAPPETLAGVAEPPETGGGIVVGPELLEQFGYGPEEYPDLIGQGAEIVVYAPRGESQTFSLQIAGIAELSWSNLSLATPERLALLEWWYDDPEYLTHRGYDEVTVRTESLNASAQVADWLSNRGFDVRSLKTLLDMANRGMVILQTMLGSVGGLALFVASIGIANTMIMAVYERTKEIGILKAVGAAPGQIRALFVVEASLIGLLGGITGTLLGWLLGKGLNWLIPKILEWQEVPMQGTFFVVTWWLVLAALAFATLVGLLAGLYPAARAARLAPLDALRYE
ncbi:MAG: ABC transporter permease [Anaerolineae bacterium]|jgi:ABC-type antimicrobial peptide transport system permease subunit